MDGVSPDAQGPSFIRKLVTCRDSVDLQFKIVRSVSISLTSLHTIPHVVGRSVSVLYESSSKTSRVELRPLSASADDIG